MVNSDYESQGPSTKVIDYSTSEGRKLYFYAMTNVGGRDDEGYNCMADGLYASLQDVQRRGRQYGWDLMVFDCPPDQSKPLDNLVNICTNYREISMKQILEHEKIYPNDVT